MSELKGLSGADIVQLDVGGRIFKTTRSTLLGPAGNAFFSALLEAAGPEATVFLDRDPDYFACVLSFLRSGRLVRPPSLDASLLDDELRYFGLGRFQGGPSHELLSDAAMFGLVLAENEVRSRVQHADDEAFIQRFAEDFAAIARYVSDSFRTSVRGGMRELFQVIVLPLTKDQLAELESSTNTFIAAETARVRQTMRAYARLGNSSPLSLTIAEAPATPPFLEAKKPMDSGEAQRAAKLLPQYFSSRLSLSVKVEFVTSLLYKTSQRVHDVDQLRLVWAQDNSYHASDSQIFSTSSFVVTWSPSEQISETSVAFHT